MSLWILLSLVPIDRGWLSSLSNLYEKVVSSVAQSEEDAQNGHCRKTLADLIVLDQDIFSVDTYAIHQTRVLLTMVDGNIVHEN